MKTLRHIVYLTVLISIFACCDQMEAIPDPEVGTISGQVMHHEFPVRTADVYIKHDALEFPGIEPENYDQKILSEEDGSYQFTDLAKGDYYLFSSGYDIICNCDVIGGIPVSLESNSAILVTNIPVTE